MIQYSKKTRDNVIKLLFDNEEMVSVNVSNKGIHQTCI